MSALFHEHGRVLRIMKLNFLFLFLCYFHLSATVFSQQMKVSLDLEQVTLEEFFKTIQSKTGVYFLYNSDLFEKNNQVSIRVQDEELASVLTGVLGERGLMFKFQNEVIVVIKEKTKSDELQQQQAVRKLIRGVVTDRKGETLPGVSVVIKGTTTGVATGLDGRFELNITDSPDVVLRLSYIGMQTKEVRVGTQTDLKVVLEVSDQSIDEVVITGYQTISKERATGSFDIIEARHLEKPMTNVAAALVGTVAGVQATLDLDGTASRYKKMGLEFPNKFLIFFKICP